MPSFMTLKFANKFKPHSGQAGDSWRDPESRTLFASRLAKAEIEWEIWIAAFAAMTPKEALVFCCNISESGH
jgi:hypothetical protein